jgi:hypothetical protein
MMASEGIEKLAELVNEFGDFKLQTPDLLEAKWLNDVTDIRYDPDREAIIIAAED